MVFVRVVIVILGVGLAVGLAQAECQCCPESWVPYDGYCYRVFETPATFGEAEQHCQQFCGSDDTGHLVSIHSKEDNDFVFDQWTSTVDPSVNMLLGLTDQEEEGNFIWSDNTPFDYIAWEEDEPNNAGGNENCVHIRIPETLAWNDVPCSNEYAYMCKLPQSSY